MTRNYLFIFLLVFNFAFLQAQSIHQTDSAFYRSQTKSIVSQQNNSSKLNKVVFGYLPWWEYYAGTHKSIRYDLLTHLAVFSFEADSSGNLKDPFNWPWNDVINSAKANGVKLIATISNFNGDDIHSLFTDTAKRSNLFNNIKTKLESVGFSGVNIDFEYVKDEDKPTAIGNFFAELKKYLSAINPSYEISFASPSVNFGNWNFSSIAQNCDYLFVMCYDFYGAWSSTTGPSSPFQGIYFGVSNSFNKDYASLVSSVPQKLILGVPYYGNYWKTKTDKAYTPVDTTKTKKEFVQTFKYREIFPVYDNKEKMWDNISKTSWLRWQDTTWKQIWYDSDSSLAIKYDFAIQKKLGGIGIWALGYDDGRQELWKLIERKFTGTVEITKELETIPTSLQLYQNYPNPFNPETVIIYKVEAASHVILKVYDLLGREVAKLVDEFKQAGKYNCEFRIDNGELTSGIYFYTLSTSLGTITQKMMLIR